MSTLTWLWSRGTDSLFPLSCFAQVPLPTHHLPIQWALICHSGACVCLCARPRVCLWLSARTFFSRLKSFCGEECWKQENYLWWDDIRLQISVAGSWISKHGMEKMGLKRKFMLIVWDSKSAQIEPVFPSRCLHVRMWLHKYMHTWTSGWPQVYIHLLHANSLAAIFVRVWVWIRSSQHCCLTHSIPSCLSTIS